MTPSTSSGSCDLILSNLDGRAADINFLNVLFDQHVKDAVWFGTGADRCAIVSLDSQAYADKVLLAQQSFRDPALRTPVTRPKRTKRGAQAAAATPEDANTDSMTVEELLALDSRSVPAAPQAQHAAAVTSPTETMIHFNDIVCNGRVVFVDRSPISLESVLKTNALPTWARGGRGEARPQPTKPPAKKSEPVKRSRDASATGGFRQAPQGGPSAGGFRSTRVALDDDNDNNVKAADTIAPCAAVADEPKEAKKVIDEPQPQRKKPTSSSKEVESTSTAPVVKVDAPRIIPVAARSSKDACKFCGSELHLSRHCPDKGK